MKNSFEIDVIETVQLQIEYIFYVPKNGISVT